MREIEMRNFLAVFLLILCRLMASAAQQSAPNVTVSPLVTIVNSSSSDPVIITCTASGNPLPSITWVKERGNTNNGITQETVNGNTVTSMLTINNPRDPDESNYTCSANNSVGQSSITAQLFVQDPASISIHPTGSTSVAGTSVVNLFCSVQGLPIPAITWLKNGQPLAFGDSRVRITVNPPGFIPNQVDAEFGLISSTLLIQDLVLSDAGSYICQAENNGALNTIFTVNSNQAEITVDYPPLVTVMPSTVIVVQTNPLTLTCQAFGIPTPTIEWFRSSSNASLMTGGTITVTTTANGNNVTSNLTISSVIKSDTATYTCTGSNGQANIINSPENASSQVEIQVPANITVLTSSTAVGVEGQSIVLSFLITEDDPPVSVENIRWEFVSLGVTVDITNTSSSHYVLSEDRRNLTIQQLTSAQAGMYTLFATNEAGVRSNSIRLEVQSPPVLFSIPSDKSILEGDIVTFRCIALGDPFPSVMWIFKNTILSNGDKYQIESSGGDFGLLRIMDTTFSDRGTYTCTFNNTIGTVSTTVRLNVQVEPQVVEISVPEDGTAGGSVVFTCIASGFPAPSISWTKNGVSFTESSRPGAIITQSQLTLPEPEVVSNRTSMLQINILVLSDVANYSCIAENSLARPQEEESTEESFDVLYPPDVTLFPQAVTINQTGSTSFLCRAFGIPPPIIEWFYNDTEQPISNSTHYTTFNMTAVNGSNLTIVTSTLQVTDAVRIAHEGSYECQATNDVDNLINTPESQSAILTVHVPPRVLVVGPSSLLGVVNFTVTLNFTIVDDFPEVRLQNIVWRFNNTALNNLTVPSDSRYSFSNDLLSLTISNLQHTDEGVYTLTATNEAGTNSSSVNVEIQAAPVILSGPMNEERLERDTAVFNCSASAEPLHSVQWFFNEMLLTTNNTKYTIDNNSTSPYYGRLMVNNVNQNDTGQYACEVSNVHGNASASANLQVQVIPTFLQHPELSSTRIVGENVSFSCESFAIPSPSIIWLKDGTPLDISVTSLNISFTAGVNTNASTLFLGALNFSDSAQYTCQAENELVSVQRTNSSLGTLIVNFPVELRQSPANITVNETDRVTFTCEAFGLPQPSFIWSTSDSSDLSIRAQSDADLEISDTGTRIGATGGFIVQSNLTFESIADSDAGQYNCTVSNMPTMMRNSSDTASFFVVVQTKPVVTALHTSNTIVGVQFRNIQLQFMISRDLPAVQTNDIQWFFQRTGDNDRENITPDNAHYNFTTDQLSLTIFNLSQADDGVYTVEASNIVGTGSDNITLDVQKAPVIIVELVPLRQLTATNASFTCQAQAIPLHTTQWQMDGVELMNNAKYSITGLGSAVSVLTIINLELSDAGNYVCFVENLHGNDSTSDELIVQDPPRIVEFTRSSDISPLVASSNATITCNATGFPAPNVTILKDGSPLDLNGQDLSVSSSSGNLHRSVSVLLTNLDFFDSGVYSCNATNYLASFQRVMSQTSPYTVQYPPNITLAPESITVNESDSVSFVCESFGVPAPQLLWYNTSTPAGLSTALQQQEGVVTISNGSRPHFSGFPITTSTLTIVRVLKHDETNYTCVAVNNVTNLLDTPENATSSLTVQVPPTVQPVNSSLLGVVYRNVTIEFNILRASPLVSVDNIRWTFTSISGDNMDITNLAMSDRRTLTNDLLQLTITNITMEDEGNYTLTASNPAGVNSGTVILSVEAAPEFTQRPVDLQRLQGETAVLNCSATSEPVHSVRWTRGGTVIAQYLSPYDQESSVLAFDRLNNTQRNVSVTTVSNIQLAGLGEFYGQLTIINTSLADGQNYTCTVSNVHGTLSATASLTVQVTPDFPEVFPINLNTSAGATIKLRCTATGQPEPNITWYKDGAEVTSGVETMTSLKRTNSTLTLVDVDMNDTGLYWCNATNELFVRLETMSPTGLITVHYHPNITTFNSPTGLVRNQSAFATFICIATGFPLPPIRWSRQGSILTSVPGKFLFTQFSESSSVPGTVRSTLAILNLTLADASQYTCTGENSFNVENHLGAVNSASANLSIQLPPRVNAVTSRNMFALWGQSVTLQFDESNALPLISPNDLIWQFQRNRTATLTTIVADTGRMFSPDRQSLVISNVGRSDEGRYTLTTSNAAGVSSDFINLTVFVAPELRPIQGEVLMRALGGSVNITCMADGLPEPRVVWRRNGSVILTENTNTGRLVVTTKSERPGFRAEIPTQSLVSSQLVIKQVLETDNNTQLTCSAVNNFGQSVTITYTLTIAPILNPCMSNPCRNNGQCYPNSGTSFMCVCSQGYTGQTCEQNVLVIIAPAIISPPKPVYQTIYTPVNLTCIATGSPAPQIKWYKDGLQLSGRVLPYLYIPELEVQDRGYYHCTATAVYTDGTSDTVTSESVVVNIQGVLQYSTEFVAINPQQTFNKSIFIEQLNKMLSGVSLNENTVVHAVTMLDGGESSTHSVRGLLTVVSGSDGSTLLQNQIRQALSNIGSQFIPTFTTVDQLMQRFSVANITRYDGCASEPTVFSDSLVWPEIDIGQNASISCPCGDLSLGVGHPSAQRQCIGSFTNGAQWSTANDTPCNFEASTQQLCRLSELLPLSEAVNMRTDELNPTELTVITSTLEQTINQTTANETLRVAYLDLIERIISSRNIQNAQQTGNVSARILTLIESFTELNPGSAYTRPSFSTIGKDVNTAIQQPVTFNSSQLTSETPSVSILIPYNSLRALNSGQTVRLTHTIYSDDQLFRTPQPVQLVSAVLSTSIVDSVNLNNLNEPIVLQFTKKLTVNMSNPMCVFWDFTLNGNLGGWSQDGCELSSDAGNFYTCNCSHLTHFAIIGSPPPDVTPVTEIPIIRMVAIVFVIISTLFLVLTAMVHLISIRLRYNIDAKLLVNNCCTLSALYIVFIGSTYAVVDPIACTVLSALFHYAFIASLVSITLSVCYYMNAFRKIGESYDIFAVCVTWILPVFVVVFCVAPGYQLYANQTFCRPIGVPFYVGMAVPFILAMTGSWIILIAVSIAVRQTVRNSQQWIPFLQSSSVSVLYGVGWSFGLAMTGVTGTAATVLGVLFIVTGGLLGVYVFLIYGVLSPTVRTVWRGWLCCNVTHKEYILSSQPTPKQQDTTSSQDKHTAKTASHDAVRSPEEMVQDIDSKSPVRTKSSSLESLPERPYKASDQGVPGAAETYF